MKQVKPILFIFSGLPATGKSTLSKLIAQEYGAVYLRIDTVEQGLRDLCRFDVQGEGYGLSYKIAIDNLKLGHNVVADSCNPMPLTRKEWENVAKENNSTFINIEVLCSNKEEHKKRVETRKSEISGLKLPAWKDVENREYHPWDADRIVVDTVGRSIEESFEELKEKINYVLNSYKKLLNEEITNKTIE
jgi:predicted kinase